MIRNVLKIKTSARGKETVKERIATTNNNMEKNIIG